MSQFIQLLAKTVVRQVDTFSQAALRKITSFFSSYRPTVSFDELTGNKNCASMVKTTGDAHANQSTVSETLALWPRFIEPLFLDSP